MTGVLPPPHLMQRVARNTDAGIYLQLGEQAAAQLMDSVSRWSGRPARDVLDWGCGPGRVTAWLIQTFPGVTVRGCDIDAEAIAWCNQQVLPGGFDVTGPYPPLPYPDGSFDAIIACSVMTHLSRRAQRAWLRELARVLRPGGILAATVHGRAAAASFGVQDLVGIQDHYLDESLNGIAPERYYRAVLQTEAYTRKAWPGLFEIAAYRESAIGLQDLVVCRVPD